MALTEDNSGIPATMLVGPTGYAGGMPYPVYQGGNSGMGFGGDWGWIVLLLLLAGNGGWGMGGFGGFGGGLGYDFPWLLNGQNGINNNVSDGFRSAQLSDGITSIRDGINSLSTQLCGCCGDMQMALANGFAGVEQGANARQVANMQTAFAGQTAMAQGFTGVNSGIADLRYTVATENCADRAALSEGIRDVIANQTAGVQRILDKLCDQELQAERRDNANLRQQLAMADLRASQTAQTADLRQSGATQLNQLVNELRSCPIPSYSVYGNQPVFTCAGPTTGNGCGCGCGGNGTF